MAANRHKNPEQFKKMRNHVNNLINKSKNSYFKKYFSEHSKMQRKYGKVFVVLSSGRGQTVTV